MRVQSTERLADRTAERLFQMISESPEYTPGARLPSEAQLCQRFCVSRTTLRDAIRCLSAQGYLEVRRGSGTYVREAVLRQDIGLGQLESVRVRLRDLFEIRMMVEPQAAMLACQRATEAELQDIVEKAEAVNRAIREDRDIPSAEQAFHHAVVRAAHNQFMERLLPIINNALRDTWNNFGTEQKLADTTLQDNLMLMDFVRRRDAQGARFAMAAHIRHTINFFGFSDLGGI